jgi:hypothetical protein
VTINSDKVANSVNLKNVFGSQVTEYIIGNRVKSIREKAFYGCEELKSITILKGVTSIGVGAFAGCEALKSVIIPASVTSIGEEAFYYCKVLTGITIPESVTSIGNSAFAGCSSLTSVTVPSSVTSIGNWAFAGCSSLQTINYLGTKKQWKGIEDTNLTIEPKKQIVVHCTDGDVKLIGK